MLSLTTNLPLLIAYILIIFQHIGQTYSILQQFPALIMTLQKQIFISLLLSMILHHLYLRGSNHLIFQIPHLLTSKLCLLPLQLSLHLFRGSIIPFYLHLIQIHLLPFTQDRIFPIHTTPISKENPPPPLHLWLAILPLLNLHFQPTLHQMIFFHVLFLPPSSFTNYLIITRDII
jgi:hypothetical protein